MISVSATFNNKQSAAVREVNCKVEVYSGSTLQATYTKADRIISVDIQRTGDNSKLFGYTVTQRVNIHLQDLSRQLNISSNQKLKVYLGYDNEYINFPTFIITEVNRDERTNELSITGYDYLYFLSRFNYGNLGLTGTKSINDMGNAIAHLLYTPITTAKKRYISDTSFNLSYTTAPFEYDTDLKTVLTQICEATQTIAYMDYTDNLTFIKLKNDNASTGTIDKSSYFNLKTKENKKLTTIFYEGAQSVSATTGATGTTQYIRDNKLLDSRSDLQTILNNAIDIIGGTIIPQFEMEWRGKVQLEYGDKIGITTKNNTVVSAYLLDDTIKFNGALVEITKFSFEKQESEIEGKNYTISEALTANKVGLEKAIEIATAEINGAKGGYVTIIDADKDGNPDNIFITDMQITSDDIVLYNGAYVLSNDTNCTKVLRINKNGLGISSGTKAGTASNGFQTTVTGSGINASTITTGHLSANYIQAGVISSNDNSAIFSLDSNIIKFTAFPMQTVLSSGQLTMWGWDQVNDDDYKRIGGFGRVENDVCGNPWIYADTSHAESLLLGVGSSNASVNIEIKYKNTLMQAPTTFNYNATFNAQSVFNAKAYFAKQLYAESSINVDGGLYADCDIYMYKGHNFTQEVTAPTAGTDNICLKSQLVNQSTPYWVGFGFGYDTEPKRPKVSFVHAGTAGNLWMTSGGVLKWNNNNVTTNSSEAIKTNIEKSTIDALKLINESEIYKFKYTDDKDEYPNKYGLVIERECPQEVIDNSGDSINLYSMTSISWQAIKELTDKIERLEARIKELEKAGE